MNIIRLLQDRETPTVLKESRAFSYRYAYSRSADSRNAGDPGQDYLTILEDGNRLVFVLCDGVSQSFYGDLAARLLGDGLADWLDALAIGNNPFNLEQAVVKFLNTLTETASVEVRNYVLPDNIPVMLQKVLEKKRSLGSESTFVAGLLDQTTHQYVFVWMGDSRLRFWDKNGEKTASLGETFLTRERWSSHKGPVGQVHVFIGDLSNLQRVLAYSDGFAQLDRLFKLRSPSQRAINELITDSCKLPASDDISFLEIWPGAPSTLVTYSPKSPEQIQINSRTRGLKASWNPIKEATAYEVQIWQGATLIEKRETKTPFLEFNPTQDMSQISQIRVRAWQDDEPGEWWDEPVANLLEESSSTVLSPSSVPSLELPAFPPQPIAALPASRPAERPLDSVPHPVTMPPRPAVQPLGSIPHPVTTPPRSAGKCFFLPVGLLGVFCIMGICLLVIGVVGKNISSPVQQTTATSTMFASNTSRPQAKKTRTIAKVSASPTTTISSATATLTVTASLTPTATSSIAPIFIPTAALTVTTSITPAVTPSTTTQTAISSITSTPTGTSIVTQTVTLSITSTPTTTTTTLTIKPSTTPTVTPTAPLTSTNSQLSASSLVPAATTSSAAP